MSLESFKEAIVDRYIEETYPFAFEDGYLTRRQTIEINAIENFFDRLVDWNLLKLGNNEPV